MRKNYCLAVFIAIAIVSLSSFIEDASIENDNNAIKSLTNIDGVPKSKVNQFIKEVYGVYGDQVISENDNFYKALKFKLLHKFRYDVMTASSSKEYQKLSEVPLMTKYNATLERDTTFDPLNFNPLKYDFNFNYGSHQVFQVDNSDFLIIVGNNVR
jgi:hypothetical protein